MARRARSANNVKGSRQRSHSSALLLVDVINELEFPGAEKLYPRALPMARRLASLKRRAATAGVPCIYVNDNFGQWRSDFRSLVDRCLHGGTRGEPIANLLAPSDEDYFVLKPMHSGFHSTTLDLLLRELGARRLIIGGMATDACVLFTASDAYIRGFEVIVPRDGCASETTARHAHALDIMTKMLKARTTPCARVRW